MNGKPFFRIVHFSDLHEACPMHTVHGFFDKRLIGHLNYLFFRGKKHLSAFIPPAVERMLDDRPDTIVFSGDATTCGQPEEFRRALELLRPLTESGIPILYVPGNHDAYVGDPVCVRALDSFTRELTSGLLSIESYPKALDLGPLRFLLFHVSRPTNPALSCGFLKKSDAEFLEKICANKTRELVSVCHYSLNRRENVFCDLRRGLYGRKRVSDFMDKIDLSLCGHIHKPFRDTDSSGRGENDSGSLTRYGVYSVIDFDGKTYLHTTRKVSL